MTGGADEKERAVGREQMCLFVILLSAAAVAYAGIVVQTYWILGYSMESVGLQGIG